MNKDMENTFNQMAELGGSDERLGTNTTPIINAPILPKNTRPAAPVEGLERYDISMFGNGAVEMGGGEYVRYDQAVAIIAAKDVALTKEEADHTRSLEERDRYHDIADKLAQAIADRYQADIGEHSNINDPWKNALDLIEADNAALTARVKEAEQIAVYETAVAQAEIDGRKALETQLAAARKALEWYANPEIYKPHPHGIGFEDRDKSYVAKAALEASK